MSTVMVRYFAGARAAAGVDHDEVPAGSLAAVLAQVRERRGPALGTVLGAASYLIDGVAAHDHGTLVPAGGTIDVLPPFAGG